MRAIVSPVGCMPLLDCGRSLLLPAQEFAIGYRTHDLDYSFVIEPVQAL
jgi:hypothetical protein